MNLISRSENDRNWPKMAKPKTVKKTTYMLHFGSKPQETGQ